MTSQIHVARDTCLEHCKQNRLRSLVCLCYLSLEMAVFGFRAVLLTIATSVGEHDLYKTIRPI